MRRCPRTGRRTGGTWSPCSISSRSGFAATLSLTASRRRRRRRRWKKSVFEKLATHAVERRQTKRRRYSFIREVLGAEKIDRRLIVRDFQTGRRFRCRGKLHVDEKTRSDGPVVTHQNEYARKLVRAVVSRGLVGHRSSSSLNDDTRSVRA